MHLITLQEPLNLGKTLGVLSPGKWVVHDVNAFEFGRLAPRGTVQVSDIPSGGTIPGNERMLVVRMGAIGDLLLLTPVLRALYREGGIKVSLCCSPHHFPLFAGCDFLDELVPYPLAFQKYTEFEHVVSLENTMERDHVNHATDVFAKALGVPTPLDDYRPEYHVRAHEVGKAMTRVFERPTVAVQIAASVANRNYPMNQWLEVIVKLEKSGWGVVLLGQKGQLPPLPPEWQSPFIRDLSQADLSFRESAAVLSQCKAFVGVDSAFLHMCHALDVPAIGLFAAFRWETRTGKAPKTFALTGVGECAPCSWHMHAGQMFPPMPCRRTGVCHVLGGISPDRIVTRVNLLK